MSFTSDIIQRRRQLGSGGVIQPQQGQSRTSSIIERRRQTVATSPQLPPITRPAPPVEEFKISKPEKKENFFSKIFSKENLKRKAKFIAIGIVGMAKSGLDLITQNIESSSRFQKKIAEGIGDPELKKLQLELIAKKPSTRIASKKLEKWIRETSPENPTFADAVAQGVGSMGGFMLLAVASRGRSLIPAMGEALLESASVYEEKRNRGASIEEASKPADVTLLANIAINYFTNKIGILSGRSKGLIKAGISAGAESIQEGLQQLTSNIALGDDPFEGVLESMGVGGILGGVATIALPDGGDIKLNTETKEVVINSDLAVKEEVSPTDRGEVVPGVEVKEEVAKPKRVEERVTKKVEKKVEVKPIKKVEPVKKTPSKIALSIEQKAIEQGLTDKFADLAGFERINIKDQARRASELMKDEEKTLNVIRGIEPLPKGLKGTALIVAMEERIKKTGDAKLALELANSPLVAETSVAAQELRLAAEREPDSLTAKLIDLRETRKKAVEKKRKKTEKQAVKEETAKIDKQVKKVDKSAWSKFLQEIEC